MLINCHIFFQFHIAFVSSFLTQCSVENFTNYCISEFNDFKENFSSKSEYLLLNIGQYVRIIFSDLMHIIATPYIFMKKTLRAKILLITNPERMNKLKKYAFKTLNRVTFMIIFNQFNFIFFLLPLAILSFYGFIFRHDKQLKSHEPDLISYLICKGFKFCEAIGQLFVCLYLKSFLIQFITFYKFDRNFKISIIHIKQKAFKTKSLREMS